LRSVELFGLDTAALRNGSFAPLSVEVSEQNVDNIPRFLFDEYFSTDPQADKQQMILHQFMDQQTAQHMIKENAPMNHQAFAELTSDQQRAYAAEFDLSRVEEVEKHFVEKLESFETQQDLFTSENLVLESNLSAETMLFQPVPVKGEMSKLPIKSEETSVQFRELQEAHENQRAGSQQIEAAMNFDSEFTSDARGDEHSPDLTQNAPNPGDSVRSEEAVNPQQFSLPADERILQAKEAQMVAQQIARSVHFRKGVESSEFLMRLEPDHLGQLKMKISSTDEVVSARIVTDTVHTKDLLLNNISTLKESLSNAGVRFSEIEITVEESSTGFDFDAQDQGSGLESRTSSNKSSTEDLAFPSYHELADEIEPEQLSSLKPFTPEIRFDNGTYSVNFLA
jgi:flagellar hook-length control protein FliK